jgi:peptidoglycan-associated lipoprotein
MVAIPPSVIRLDFEHQSSIHSGETMQRRILKRLTLIAAAAVLLGACEGQMATMEDEGMEADVVEGSTDAAADDATTQGMADEGVFQGHPLDDPSSPLSQRTIYFAFDSSHIEEENRSIIEAHALWLADHPGASVTLEGHADERGTREYNVALAERRANAVRQLLALTGASGGQINTISYGEERPAVEGHDESAWRFNRRVEVVYRNRE